MGTASVLIPSNAQSFWPQMFSGLNDRKDLFVDKVAALAFQIASYLTDPVCKSHEWYRRISIVDPLHPDACALSNLARKVSLFLGMLACASLAVFTTIPGIALRFFASKIQTNPFIYAQGAANEKLLPLNRSFSLLSWNMCCTAAGYAISDGGVMPWSFRIDNIVKKIIEKDGDVNCLYEAFDLHAAFYISEKLKQSGYKHIYYNIGPKAIGVSSGIMVASKYAIKNPEFIPFPIDTLVGRTKHAAKGVFSFDLSSRGENFARVYTTHLQHSEEPQFPTLDEVEGRKRQMEIIVEKVNAVRDRCVVVTGDLNLDDKEFKASSWHHRFQKGDCFGSTEKTWGGDEFCARMVGKRISGALNLDHTMVTGGTARAMSTTLVHTGFDPFHFKRGALSDHAGLFSEIISILEVVSA